MLVVRFFRRNLWISVEERGSRRKSLARLGMIHAKIGGMDDKYSYVIPFEFLSFFAHAHRNMKLMAISCLVMMSNYY